MSAIADIVAFDGAATPVSHTFKAGSVVRSTDGTILANWKEANPALADVAQGKIFMSLQRQKNGQYRVNSRVEIPVQETITGQNSSGYTAPSKVAYVNVVSSTGYFSERCTITERRLVRQLSNNVMNGVATSVAAVVTGPVAEMFDLLIMPA